MSSSTVPFLKDLIHEHNFVFVALTETWLRNHLDAEVAIDGYTIFRADRVRPKKRRGRESGGVAIFIKDSLGISSEILLDFSNGVAEVLMIHVKQINMIVAVIYRSPHNPSGGYNSSVRELSEVTRKISAVLNALPSPTPDIVIAGDLNLPKVSWPNCIPSPGASPGDREMIAVVGDLMSEFFLTQLVQEPTHRAGSILNVILTNNPSIFLSSETCPVAPHSSHYLVEAQTTIACSED